MTLISFIFLYISLRPLWSIYEPQDTKEVNEYFHVVYCMVFAEKNTVIALCSIPASVRSVAPLLQCPNADGVVIVTYP